MGNRINDILDKIIETDHSKGKAKPAEAGVGNKRRQDNERSTRADAAAGRQAQRRSQGRERVARILETGFIE
ncbi:MAG: hypothetical protein U0641_10000 [Anaerolineae bacterium]